MFHKTILFAALSFMLLQYFSLNAQTKDNIRVTITSQTDVRKLAQDYFGDPDLWTYILKYNNIKDLSSVQSPVQVIIPQKKVKDLLELFDDASRSIQDAVKAGAKILSPDLLDKSSNDYYDALKAKNNLDFDSSLEFLIEAVDQSKKAYNRTMEIREKTLDAVISYKKGTVQKMFPSVLNWENAELYDNLKENDWARTLSLSLANITFNDLSQIKLYENSEAEIQRSRVDVIGNNTNTKIKLEKGNAYAMLMSSPKKKFDLDIPGVRTKINSKYFWIEKNSANAKLANYNGEITLGVKDSSVIVRKNQGSVIPDGGYPSKPRKLIPPPELIYPEDFSAVTAKNVKFNWQNAPGVPDYSLEISTTGTFKIVDKSYNKNTGSSLEISGLKPGVYYWHVCSVDSLGLPGPFSEIRSVIILRDTAKPFLNIDYPVDNFISRTTELKITGKTNSGCKILVNHNNVVTGTDGVFEYDLVLKEGKNTIQIESINPFGNAAIIFRNVFVESDPEIKISDRVFGDLTRSSTYYTAKNILNLNLSTRPLSRVRVESLNSQTLYTAYSDSLGRCGFSIPFYNLSEKFLINVITPAGFEKSSTFNVLKKSENIEIILDPSVPSLVNHKKINISGKVLGAEELFINGTRIPLNEKNEFSSPQDLTGFNNIFTIEAVNRNGSTESLEKKIICDDKPPKLISSGIQVLGDNIYQISVKADDENGLSKSAEAEISLNDSSLTEILPYNSAAGLYELTFMASANVKPRIKSVTLENELNNKKTYLLLNKN
jgi:hypothetical protein